MDGIMLTARTKIAKVVLIRHGALGDVLAVRSTLRYFKDTFPDAEVSLIAPEVKGRFFDREGWADRVHDWDRGAFSWLFTEEENEPPVSLQAAFGGSDIVISYQDFASPEAQERFEHRLDRLSPSAGKVFCPSRPPAGHEHPIGEWLLSAALGFCDRFGLAPAPEDRSPWLAAKVAMARPSFPGLDEPYLVIHPGSGGTRKNWPVENFGLLAKLMQAAYRARAGTGLRIVATSGEADGDLGKRFLAEVPEAFLLEMPDLDCLAAVLAHARYYLGNDSGVSHLASAVCREDGIGPSCAAVFGPSEAAVWGPTGASMLFAGEGMDELSSETAFLQIQEWWREFT